MTAACTGVEFTNVRDLRIDRFVPAEEVLIDRTVGLRRLTEKKEEEAPFFSSNSAFSLKRAR